MKTLSWTQLNECIKPVYNLVDVSPFGLSSGGICLFEARRIVGNMIRYCCNGSVCICTVRMNRKGCSFFWMKRLLTASMLLCSFLLPIVVSAQLANSGWPKFRGDIYNSGTSFGANVLPQQIWSQVIQVNNGLQSSPSTGPDGSVFVGNGAAVCCLNPGTGVIKWTTATSGQVEASPAVGADGTVYVGSVGTSGGTFYALNGSTGAVKWSISTTAPIYSSASIDSDNVLYFATYGGQIYSVNPTSGAINWKISAGAGEAFESSPALDSFPASSKTPGVLYIGSHSGNLFALDKVGGTIAWTYFAAGAIDSSPTLQGGTLYFGCADGNLYSVNTSGSLNWKYQTGGPVFSSPAIGPSQAIVFGSEDGNVYALNGGGTLIWSFSTGSKIDSSPAVGADGTVYIGPGDGNIYSLNGLTGSKYWAFPTAPSVGSPSFGGDGRLYVLSGQTLIGLESVHVTKVQLTPSTVLAGTVLTGSVVMNLPAPAQGAYVAFNADNIAIDPPGPIVIPQGQSHTQFLVDTNGVDSTLTADLYATPGIDQFGPVTITACSAKSLTLNPSTVTELGFSNGLFTLNAPAGPNGVPIGISGDARWVSFLPKPPPPLKIGYGGTTFAFTVLTNPVDDITVVPITVSGAGSLTADLTINPATLIGLSLSPVSVAGGNSSTGTITFDLPAGPDGQVVNLTSSNASAQVPATVTMPGLATSTTFTIKTTPVSATLVAQITANVRKIPQSANLTIGPVALSSISVSPSPVLGGQSAVGTVTLNGTAGSVGVVVTLQSSDAVAVVPRSVTVPAGATFTTFAISTTVVGAQHVVTISGSEGGQSPTATLIVDPPTPAALSLSPATVLGGGTSTGTLTLNGPAGPTGVTVALSSNTPSATVPASVNVVPGSSTATFTVSTTGVNTGTKAVITASLVGISQSANLTITPTSVLSFTLSPLVIVGGQTSTGIITLLGPASPGGTPVQVASLNPIATVPSVVTVPAGQTTGTFTITTHGITSPTYAIITVSMNGQLQQTLTLNLAKLVSVSFSPSTVAGLSTSTGSVYLNGPAGPVGVLVGLSSNSKLVSVPSSMSIPAGQSSGTFVATPVQVTKTSTATISANLLGITESAVLTLAPDGLLSVSVSPSTVNGGVLAVGTASLIGIAPKGGVTVQLSSSNTSAVSVPGSVKVPEGSISSTFSVKTMGVPSVKTVSITGKSGATTATTSITVEPPVLLSLVVNPTSVGGGASSTGTVTISGSAPSGGLPILLSSNTGSATVPAKVSIPAGKSSITFTIKTSAVSTATTAKVTGSLNGNSDSATLMIGPTTLVSITLNPTNLEGGKSSNATVSINAPAPAGGLKISISSDSSVATVPSSVTIPAGKTSASFTIPTKKVTSSSTARVTATFGTSSVSATLTVT